MGSSSGLTMILVVFDAHTFLFLLTKGVLFCIACVYTEPCLSESAFLQAQAYFELDAFLLILTPSRCVEQTTPWTAYVTVAQCDWSRIPAS